MRAFSLALSIIVFSLVACDGKPASEADAKDPTMTQRPEKETSKVESPYRLLGILDPDRNQMVAFALKVPRGWKVEQSFRRQWEGAVAHNQIYVAFRSPDGNSQIEYLPAFEYAYADGPLSNGLRSQKRSMGIPTQMSNNELPPMPPVPYIKQKVLPFLAQNGFALHDIHNEQTAPEERGENGQTKMRGSVDGILPNGHKARIECRMQVSSQRINGDTYYGWSAIPSITQTTGELDATYAHTRVAQDSIVVNPAWQQAEREAQNHGAQVNSEASRRQHEATMRDIQANTDTMTRAHEQRMNGIRQFGEANTARFNQRMSDMDRNKAAFDSRMNLMDRQQELRVDTIRGVSKYSDPTTGERVKVEDGYDHVYRNQQNPNLYYEANTPIDVGRVDWQELQKVDARDY